MLTLMRGDYANVTPAQLRKIPITEKGDRTDRWVGLQHGVLVDLLKEILKDEYGFVPVDETYCVNTTGSALMGGMIIGLADKKGKALGGTKVDKKKSKRRMNRDTYSQVDRIEAAVSIPGFPQLTAKAVGLWHSNDSRRSLRLSLGATVFLCENGAVFGHVTGKRKHTKGLHLKDWLKETVDKLLKKDKVYSKAAQVMADFKVSPKQHEEALLRMAREDVIPWRLIGDIDRNWHLCQGLTMGNRLNTGKMVETDARVPWVNPDRGDPAKDWNYQGTVWDHYNAVSHTAKLLPPPDQIPALERAFDLALDLIPAKSRPKLAKMVEAADDN